MSKFNIEQTYTDEDDAEYTVNITGVRERGSHNYMADSDLDYYGYIEVDQVGGDYPDHLMDKVERWVDNNIEDWLSDYFD